MNHDDQPQDELPRRDFLSNTAATAAMGGGLLAGYGMFAGTAVQFLYPRRGENLGWQFVATLDEFQVGDAQLYVAPNGAQVLVTRQGEDGTAEDFIALSSVCPHLGCQVHWEPQNDRFFCPCHNGAFDAQGNPTEGPPKDGNQQLTRFPLKVENDLLYMEVPLRSLGDGAGQVAQADHEASEQEGKA